MGTVFTFGQSEGLLPLARPTRNPSDQEPEPESEEVKSA
jgi:hypothetical protein